MRYLFVILINEIDLSRNRKICENGKCSIQFLEHRIRDTLLQNHWRPLTMLVGNMRHRSSSNIGVQEAGENFLLDLVTWLIFPISNVTVRQRTSENIFQTRKCQLTPPNGPFEISFIFFLRYSAIKNV